jgi:GT2 family glycosyltransferase/glycosyltransferase involved in cell wall biosynthesis
MFIDVDQNDFNDNAADQLRAVLDEAITSLELVQQRLLVGTALKLYLRFASKEGYEIADLLTTLQTVYRSVSTRGVGVGDAVRLLSPLQQRIRSFRRRPLYRHLVWLDALHRPPPGKLDQSLQIIADFKLVYASATSDLLHQVDPQVFDLNSDLWIRVRRPPDSKGNESVAIVVPVFADRVRTLACLHSILVAENATATRLLVIDDCSPDMELTNNLQRLASTGYFDLIKHPTNQGFVASANDGILASSADVILLNSDTLVCDRWVDHLHRAAQTRAELGSVSPLSNNATILSYPFVNWANGYPQGPSLHELCRFLEDREERDSIVEIPVTVGFCMYMPRRVIDDVGILDEAAFAAGYGEECDWAMRARRKGYRNFVTTRTFVYHHGEVSFSNHSRQRQLEAGEIMGRRYPDYWPLVAEHCSADPLLKTRRFLDSRRLLSAAGSAQTVLQVLHSLGGGTENYVRDVAKLLKARGVLSLFAQPDQFGRVQLSSNFLEHTPNSVFAGLWDNAELLTLLRELRLSCVHLHHFIGFAPEVIAFMKGLDTPLVVTLHDYSYICPQLVLLNERDQFCGVRSSLECNRCILAKPPPVATANVAQWREQTHEVLLRAERILAPSQSTAELYHRVWPDLPIKVLPHPELGFDAVSVRHSPGALRTVAVIGIMSSHKGAAIVEACVRDAEKRKLPLKFVVLGELRTKLASPCLDLLGPFRPSQLSKLISDTGAVIGFLPSIWPETYSYVLSSYYENGLHPVVFDIGAQGERLNAMGGTVLPLDMSAPAINNVFLEINLDSVPAPMPTACVASHYVAACYGELLARESPLHGLEPRIEPGGRIAVSV